MSAGAKLLVVDDEPAIRRLIGAALLRVGYGLVEAGSAREALTALQIDKPELVLLDLGLPDRDGLELIQPLKQGGPAVRRLQIQHHAALVAVRLQVHRPHAGVTEWADAPHRVTAGLLHLDHVGAEVPQDLGRRGSHDDGGEVKNTNAGQRPGARIVWACTLGQVGRFLHRHEQAAPI